MEAHSLARTRGGFAVPRSRKLLAAFSDERLVEQLRRGNDTAFEVLYDRHHRGVLSFCRHMLGSLDEAEDALQQAFVSAHADIVSSEKPIRFKAWIYTIARNRCLSMLRARREQPSEDLEVVSTTGLSDEVQQRADLKELLVDLHELPDDQRQALVLSELGDLSHSDVAEIIGCEAAKVKSLVFQARSGLIERRQARDTPCEEIREQLSTLRGGSLRRGPLRRHVKACPGCQEFREDVRRQRQMLAVVLPVIPSLGLRESAFAAVGLGGTGVAGGGVVAGGGIGAAAAAKAGVAKVAIIAVATGGAAVGGGVAVDRTILNDSGTKPAAVEPSGSAGQGAGAEGGSVQATGEAGAPAGANDATGTRGDDASREAREDDGRGRSEEARAQNGPNGDKVNGFQPERGGSNGDRARDFARTRGQGSQGEGGRAIGRDRVRTPPQRGNPQANGRDRVRSHPAPERRPQTPPPQEETAPVEEPVIEVPETTTPRAVPKPPVEIPAPKPDRGGGKIKTG